MGEWPFKARYSAWGLAAMLSIGLFLAFWQSIPGAVAILAGSYFISKKLAGSLGSLWQWAAFGMILAVVVIVYSPVLLAPKPLPWWLAFPVAIATAILITRKVMKVVNPNTPLRYWRWLLSAIAGGPRPTRDPMVFDMHNPTPEPFDLPPLIFDGLASPGGKAVQFRSRGTIEADRWLPANPERAGQTQAWLNQYGYTFTIEEGGGLAIMNDPFSMIEVRVPPGYHLFFELDKKGKPSSGVKTLPHDVFREQYVRVEDDDSEPEPLSTGDSFTFETPVMEVHTALVDSIDVDGTRVVINGTLTTE